MHFDYKMNKTVIYMYCINFCSANIYIKYLKSLYINILQKWVIRIILIKMIKTFCSAKKMKLDSHKLQIRHGL